MLFSIYINDNFSPQGVIFTGNINKSSFDVEFMTCVVDKMDDLVVTECDSHFSEFVGVHPSKINQGKLSLYDVIPPKNREDIMRQLCKKSSPYIYFDLCLKNKEGEFVYVHCTGKNYADSSLCRLTFAEIKQRENQLNDIGLTDEINNIIDIISAGVALFKVDGDMHFTPLYLNQACCRILGTTKESYRFQQARMDEFIHPDDRSRVFQAIGNSMATHAPINMELRIMAHKNEVFWCKMDSAIHKIDSDGLPIFHAVFTSIASTDTKKI